MNLDEIKEEVKSILSERRYKHSVNVMEKCEELAKIHGENIEKAKLIGITHDIAKEMKPDEMFKYVRDNKIEIDSIERKYPQLLHAKIGADICKKKYNFSDDMVKAIEAHTTGKADMDKLAKILYISDATSKEREYECVEKARILSKKDLNKTMLFLLNNFINECKESRKTIHPDAFKTVKSIKNLCKDIPNYERM